MLKKIIILTFLALGIISCGGGGGGGGADTTNNNPPPSSNTTDVNLSGKVYDQEIANARIDVYVGDSTTPAATTTSDASGNYSIDLQISDEDLALRCVVVATRGSISLRSLLGNIGAIVDIAAANGGNVTSETLPSANVTNVSTAIAALLEQVEGSLPDDQAAIDGFLAELAAAPISLAQVVQVAAAIKAVVDYGADVTSIEGVTNTLELVAALLASPDVNGDLDALLGSSSTAGLSIERLELEVSGDPILATQIPTTVDELVAVAGKTYVTSDPVNDEETLLRFDNETDVTIADYTDIESGGTPGTYVVDATSGSITVTFEDSPGDANNSVAVFTVVGGSDAAIQTQLTFTDGGTGVVSDEGSHTLRRLVPVTSVVASNSATLINVNSFVGKLFINVDKSISFKVIDVGCDSRTSTGQTINLTCALEMGMYVYTSNTGKEFVGFLADSWNGTTFSQQMSSVRWRADETVGAVAEYPRLYRPIDANTPVVGNKFLRIYPSASGQVRSQLQFITAADTVIENNTPDGGQIDVYGSGSGIARSKDHVWQFGLPSGRIVNGSVNQGAEFNVDGSTSLGLNLGTNANSGVSAVLREVDGRILTRYSYKLRNVVAEDVEGKTFAFTDLVLPETGSVTFNAGGTGSFTDSEGTTPILWDISNAIPANAINTETGVTNYGATLRMQFQDGFNTVDYVFIKSLGDAFIAGGYNLDSSGVFEETFALAITPQ